MLQRWSKALGVLLVLCMSATGYAYELGVHYFALPEKMQQDPVVKQYHEGQKKTVSVIEFFSFGCGACAYFEPKIEAFAKKLPASVSFEQVPVAFHPQWETLARTFYALELMPHDKVALLRSAIFDAIHKDKRDASQLDVMRVIFARQGIAGKDFDKAYEAFGVVQKREYAKTLSKAFKVDEIPMVVVIGPGGAYYAKPSAHDAANHFVDIIDAMVTHAKKNGV